MMAVEIRENDFLPQMEMCKLESLFIPILCIWPKHILPSRFCQLRVGFVFFICSLQLNSLSIVHGVRCRDKQRKESSRLQAVNRKLTAMNKLLMEENERLQKQVSQLVHENAHMRQQLQNVSFQVQCWPCCLHNHVMLVLKVLSSYRIILYHTC